MIGAAARGDAAAAGLLGLLTGRELEQRFAAKPIRNELCIGLTADEAREIRDELLSAAPLPAEGAE
jgi:hypothetical protein